LTFDQRRNVGPPDPFKPIARPMTRHGAIVDFRRPLSNGHGLEDLAVPGRVPSAGARLANVVLTAKLLAEVAFEDAATVHESTAVDRFGRHVQVSIARNGVSEPSRDLLRRPWLGALAGHGTSEGWARRPTTGLRTATAPPRLSVSAGRAIHPTATMARHVATPR
jgi:hypothetical protein